MARRIAMDEQAIEFQVALRHLRRTEAAPLWEAAVATGDWDQLADAKALDGVLGTYPGRCGMTRREVCRFLGHALRYRFVGPLEFVWCDECRAMR